MSFSPLARPKFKFRETNSLAPLSDELIDEVEFSFNAKEIIEK